MFIAIDGPNGAGKSSVAMALAETLRSRGSDVTLLAQPSQGAAGRMARAQEHELIGWPLAALVVADRYLQIAHTIEPALARGAIVIVDRYVPSTLVLQRLDGLDPELLWAMNAQVLHPDLTVILHAATGTLRDRLRHRARLSRFEQVPGGTELEIRYYAEAVEKLKLSGYQVMEIDTTNAAVTAVVHLILTAIDESSSSP